MRSVREHPKVKNKQACKQLMTGRLYLSFKWMDNEIPIRWNKSSSQCLVNRVAVLPSFMPWIWCWKSCIIAWSDCDHLRCYRSSCHSWWGQSIPPYCQTMWRATAHCSASSFASMVTCSSSSCSLQEMHNATLWSTASNPLTGSSVSCPLCHYYTVMG